MKKSALPLIGTALGLLACDGVFDSDNDKVATDTFSAAVEVVTQNLVSVEGINGNVTITGSAAADSVSVDAVLEVRARTVEEARAGLDELDVAVETAEDEVVIRTIQPLDTDGRTFVVNYEITVPAGLGVGIANVNGNIGLVSIDGDVSVSNSNGNLTLLDITGSAIVEVGNGEIDARVVLPVGGTISATTGNGNTDLLIPVSTSAVFSANVGNGRIEVLNLELSNMATTNKSVTGTLGGGEGLITLVTGNGNITASGF